MYIVATDTGYYISKNSFKEAKDSYEELIQSGNYRGVWVTDLSPNNSVQEPLRWSHTVDKSKPEKV